jgi:hypothetical protein
MIRPFLVLPFLAFLALPAQADSCDDLVQALELAISEPGIAEAAKSDLQGMMSTARDAKSKGDAQACETELQAFTQSPLPNLGSPTKDCNKNEEHSV